jgi:membrane-bound lytic murein transglycosylase D
VVWFVFSFAAIAGAAAAEPPAKPPPAAPAPATPANTEPNALYEMGRALFEDYAPDEIKQQFRFPTPQEWDQFAQRLRAALENSDLTQLAAYETEARVALAVLDAWPDYSDYADWLRERIDYIEGAKQTAQPPSRLPVPPAPYYELWRTRVSPRPVPPRASALLPVVRREFVAAGLPPELAWLAEVESGFNPVARSPAGARGLYQLMPATARDLGLSTLLPDERTDPVKNARAAATYLRTLHGEFRDWPLALAAYNAGPGRVRRTLAERKATTFTAIAPALPAETRMYVPKVYATIATRAGPAAVNLPPPGPGK